MHYKYHVQAIPFNLLLYFSRVYRNIYMPHLNDIIFVYPYYQATYILRNNLFSEEKYDAFNQRTVTTACVIVTYNFIFRPVDFYTLQPFPIPFCIM